MDCAFGQMSDETSFAQSDIGCRTIIRQHGDHRVAAACPGEIGGLLRTEFDERAAFPGTAIEHSNVVSGPDEVGRHRGAHASKSDKSYFHIVISC